MFGWFSWFGWFGWSGWSSWSEWLVGWLVGCVGCGRCVLLALLARWCVCWRAKTEKARVPGREADRTTTPVEVISRALHGGVQNDPPGYASVPQQKDGARRRPVQRAIRCPVSWWDLPGVLLLSCRLAGYFWHRDIETSLVMVPNRERCVTYSLGHHVHTPPNVDGVRGTHYPQRRSERFNAR